MERVSITHEIGITTSGQGDQLKKEKKGQKLCARQKQCPEEQRGGPDVKGKRARCT